MQEKSERKSLSALGDRLSHQKTSRLYQSWKASGLEEKQRI
jgi:hypothetical protein